MRKKFFYQQPETRRKRSVCSRASKCTIERVPYLILKKLWAFENRQFVRGIYGVGCIGKYNTNNLPAPTDMTENLYGKKKLFLTMQLKNRPRWYSSTTQNLILDSTNVANF
jgi:hypothetical protein